MRRELERACFWLWALCLALSVGCSSAPSQDDNAGGATVGVSVGALSSADVTKVTLTISGPGIAVPIVHDLTKSAGQWTAIIGGIPAGTDRTFAADAFDSSNAKIYAGQASGVTIVKGAMATVLIALQQTEPAAPFGNAAPRIESLVASTRVVEPAESVVLNLVASDADGDVLLYAWTAPAGSFTDASSATPTWTAPDTEGDYQLSVTVTDGRGGNTGLSFAMTVSRGKGSAKVTTSFNTWPAVSQVSAAQGQLGLGESTIFDVTAQDADGDVLAYSWTDNCSGAFSSTSAKTPTWTAPAAIPEGGTCSLSVTVTDGRGGSGSGTLVVQIGSVAANAPPVLDESFQSAAAVDPGGAATFRVKAHDPEGNAITFAWTATVGTLGAPSSTADGSEVSWTAPTPFASSAVAQIDVSIDDGKGGVTVASLTVNGSDGIVGKLVINEIDYDQPATDTAEFVEIYNGTSAEISLVGYALIFVNGTDNFVYRTLDLSSAGTLAAGGFLVVHTAGVTPSAGALSILVNPATDYIQNGSPDGVVLVSATSVVDALSYEGPMTAVDLGSPYGVVSLVSGSAVMSVDIGTGTGSLSRLMDGVDTGDDASDWGFTSTITPGTANVTTP